MKIKYIFLFIISIFLPDFIHAQVFNSAGYYYNNFNAPSLGMGITQVGTNTALNLSSTNNLTYNAGFGWASIGNAQAATYQLSFITANTNLDNETFGYEWTLLYRNNGANTDNSDEVSNGKNAWKYWLLAENSNLLTAKGVFLTQVGSTLYLRSKYDNSTSADHYNNLVSVDLSKISGNNATYAIRVQRIKRSGQFVWHLYVDTYTASKTEATTDRGESYINNINYYGYSAMQVSSTTAGRFVFDEMKLYSMQINISGANDTSNGISKPLIAGTQNAVIYGMRVQTRGFFDMSQLKFSVSGNITQMVTGNMYLNRSTDDFFGNSDDVMVAKLDYYDGTIQNYNIKETFYSIGNADGSLVNSAYYFITVGIKTNPTPGATFGINAITDMVSSGSQINYPSSGDVVENVQTTPAAAGKNLDWVGSSSSEWNLASNWSPASIPTSNDQARIGVNTFTNQPQLSSAQSVGALIFGNGKSATLTINNATLTVTSSATAEGSATISGTGTLDIKGNFTISPKAINTINANVSTLKVEKLLFNAASATSVVFNISSPGFSVNQSIQNLSAVKGYTLNLNQQGSLLFYGTTPLLITGNETLSFLGNVQYLSNAAQNVTGAISYKDIVFGGSGKKTILGNSLNVSGNWISGGGHIDLLTNNTLLIFNGVNQNITDNGSNAGAGLSLKELKFTGGGKKTLGGSGTFTVQSNGNLYIDNNSTLNAAGKLVLKSDHYNSASVAPIPQGSAITGDVIVERFVTGGPKSMYRTYRMLSSPVYDNTTNFISDQGQGVRTYSAKQLIENMIITGPKGPENGFDISPNNGTTVSTHNGSFASIAKLTSPVGIGRGIYVFYRGDRSNMDDKLKSPYVDPESTTIRFKGILNQQSITVPLNYVPSDGTDGFSLVGNPYASKIDWLAVERSGNIRKIVRIWNPATRQYSIFNGEDEVNGGSRYIESGQSFFVMVSNSNSPSITFTENAKVSNANSSITGKSLLNVADNTLNATSSSPSKVKIKLAKENALNEVETLIVMKQGAESKATEEDVQSAPGEEVFLSSLSSDAVSVAMAINYVPEIQSGTRIKLSASAATSGNYSLQFNLSNIPGQYEVKLLDRYLNTETVLKEGSVYAFSIDKNIKETQGDSRFEISVNTVSTLPIKVSTFNVQKTNNGVQLKWETPEDVREGYFEVERATDQSEFIYLTKENVKGVGIYTSIDKNPVSGMNYYRLWYVDGNGDRTQVLNDQSVKYDLQKNNLPISVFPNPVITIFTLAYNGEQSSSTYTINIYDLAGKLIDNKQVQQQKLQSGLNIDFSAKEKGVYVVKLVDTITGKHLSSAKFIKN
ncbi:T9SS type A sorting domain-containing protein [Pedobacter montanisoli]|uniref:T9SS type A sorting domain-containing protein n=1 Tax=Pedobacter montanisoli TaxID=2923277 RepID=A0ABS9ZSY5_9SPHI|nr:T9SS type A sorting domain-containing protein [Pedobacter montanisoli]MCJ0741433.1 T9SS type A sorting domain-containing protein [Pedobacter montanisoli]